jgi:hypothetical protein
MKLKQTQITLLTFRVPDRGNSVGKNLHHLLRIPDPSLLLELLHLEYLRLVSALVGASLCLLTWDLLTGHAYDV